VRLTSIRSGLTYTSIREGIYVNAFPLFLNWYPSTETIYIPGPHDVKVAFTSREELGEANAKLLLKGGYENEIVLLTANETVSFTDVVNLINETTGRNVKLKIVSPEGYVRLSVENDQGGKPVSFWQTRLSWFEGMQKGDGAATHPLMKELLGREPRTASQMIRALLEENPDYTWHQNYVDRERYRETLKNGAGSN
jgi:uncharacterized protein YbjT (DUF2867 family)